MKGKDLLVNIQEAREHIIKLKRDAALFDEIQADSTSDAKADGSIKNYVNEVAYSLAKNEEELERKHRDFRHKLPNITQKHEELPAYAYKKQKRPTLQLSKKSQDESTRLDQSVSFAVENRQVKMHSFQEKHQKIELNSDRERVNSTLVNIQVPELEAYNKRNNSSQFRKRQVDYKKSVKYLELNKSSVLPAEPFENYKLAVDKYSLHRFVINQGKINQETPEFASYQRVYQSSFHKIILQIRRLEALLTDKNVEIAHLDGRKLAYLSLKEKILMPELVDCLTSHSVPKEVLLPRSKYIGMSGKIAAINKIISFWKMKNIRDKYLTLKKSTLLLQRFFKKNLMRLSLQKRVCERNNRMLDDFNARQAQFVETWKDICGRKRIQIHINSMEVDEEKRLTIENYQERQNIQLSRIFRLKDENLIIIYVTATELPLELLNYYYKMMELADVKDYRDRLIFITPDCASHFPNHFSTTKLLYYSSRTLNQLKIITSDLPTIVYPGHPCNELIKICTFLNCYLFSGEPQKMKCFTSKSQTKRLLKNLSIQTLPGTMEMYDYGEFLNTFSVLILKNPIIETWVLKIDDEFGGRGVAYVDVSKSKVIQSLLRKAHIPSQSETFTTDVVLESQNQEITVKIRDYLKEHLHERLVVATPSLYKSYQCYMGRFIKKGGIIEAHPPCSKQDLSFPSVSFCLEPDGEYNIIATYEKIIGQPYRGIGCSFPQKSLEFTDLNNVCRQLSESLKLRNMFGIFTVDLISFKKKNQDRWWVIDIDPYVNDYTSSFYLFDLLMAGTFLPDKNAYIVQNNHFEKDDSHSVDTMPSEENLEARLATRQYIFIPHFFDRHLSRVNIKDFFKHARIQAFNFDVNDKSGICILLLDQLASGTLGLLAVSDDKNKSIDQLKRILDFIGKISTVKNVEYGKSDIEPATDAVSLKDVLSIFTGLVRRRARRNAKERAIQRFQANQNLQLL